MPIHFRLSISVFSYICHYSIYESQINLNIFCGLLLKFVEIFRHIFRLNNNCYFSSYCILQDIVNLAIYNKNLLNVTFMEERNKLHFKENFKTR